MQTEAQKRAKKKYKEKVNRVTIDFHPSEAEMYAFLQAQPQKATYIKELIKADMKKARP